MAAVERAQPLLGTRVAIRVDDAVDEKQAHEAITAAFDEVRTVHRLMSFHEPDSDVSRLNREASRHPVRVDARTVDVLRAACTIHRASGGVFDIAVGAELVSRGELPLHPGLPDSVGDTADLVLHDDGTVSFARPLCIDLGGIAKGYAADRAAEVLRRHGVRRARVDAGGDLRLLGDCPHRVLLDAGQVATRSQAAIELGDGAVATSSHRHALRMRNGIGGSVHFDGRTRRAIATERTVTVIAHDAMHADALTKVAMALGDASAPVLRGFDANAYVFEGADWREVGGA